ncbi:MAG: VIT and vWA domain-containing protein [Myxococcales bacterium]|jgi:Ca-activated chloride channel family protein
MRARVSRDALLAVAAVACGVVWAGASVAEASSVPSPSAVLAKADGEAGKRIARFPRGPRDNVASGEDRTLAPYFRVAGGAETELLPLKETAAQVEIAGVIARVKVRQLFENDGKKPIEAIYVFPASTRAAVHGMRMKIGTRTVEARIERKQAAREQYEQARQEGKRASLLEQERPNVFTMNVANVMPGDRIEVELDYSELLVPEDAVYEFVYPTVVGPRYGGGADPKRDGWIATPYQRQGEKELYRFDLRVHLETGIALKDVQSPSHKIVVNRLSGASADIRLQESGGGNRDFVLRYRLAGDQIESGLLLWEGERENFFVLMMESPRRPTSSQIPPREYIFLLDVSGSMHGFPLGTAKALMDRLLSQLRSSDYFNVALFSGANYVMSPEGSLPATPENIKLAKDLIGRQRGSGGTELMGGLRASYGVPKKHPGVSRSVVVVTDGYVAVEAQAFKFIRERLNEANLFAFGIGTSVNRGLIEAMARAGHGEPFVVLGPEKAQAEAERLRAYIEQPVLSNIAVKFDGFAAREVSPSKVPDLMARRPVVVFGKYRGEAKGKIELTGYSGGGKYAKTIEVSPAALKGENAPIRWLWARRWVELLDDAMHLTGAKEIEDAITDLGLAYSLLTRFTSFVAIDSEVANKSGESQAVKQPLPLPEGVSDLAVAMAATPAASPAAPSANSGAFGGAQVRRKSVAAPSRRAELAQPGMAREQQKPREAAARLRAMVVDFEPAGLTDAKALLAELQRRVEAEAKACGGTAGVLRLKLFVDKDGRVLKVEVLKASEATLAKCLQAKLVGLTSATRASGAASGSLQVTIKLMAL